MDELPSDEKLLQLFENEKSQNEAFGAIVQKYRERLYWHIRKMVILHEDADDLLQKTFIKAWKALANFRGDAKLYTWLYRIATNETLTFLEQKKRRNEASFQIYEHYLSETLTSDEYFNGDEAQKLLQKAILKLPEKQRIVFNMKYFDEIKYQDMAEILDTSEGALKASYHHAVKKIEDYIKNR
jgi:RNA polymerase sigma-70 factor (ECF subfamily)